MRRPSIPKVRLSSNNWPPRARPSVDSLITRRRQSDRDLWVVEIEDSQGRTFLTEPVRRLNGG